MSEEKAKPNRKLREVEIVAAEYSRLDSIATPERGTTIAEMLVPGYWAQVSGPGEEHDGGKRMQPWQRIEVRPADRSWWAELLVVATGPFAAKVELLRHKDFAPAKARGSLDVPEGFEVKHRGRNGWCVIRLVDSQPLKEGLESQAAAALWADNHAKTFAQG